MSQTRARNIVELVQNVRSVGGCVVTIRPSRHSAHRNFEGGKTFSFSSVNPEMPKALWKIGERSGPVVTRGSRRGYTEKAKISKMSFRRGALCLQMLVRHDLNPDAYLG
jgi:hypothetical protein